MSIMSFECAYCLVHVCLIASVFDLVKLGDVCEECWRSMKSEKWDDEKFLSEEGAGTIESPEAGICSIVLSWFDFKVKLDCERSLTKLPHFQLDPTHSTAPPTGPRI